MGIGHWRNSLGDFWRTLYFDNNNWPFRPDTGVGMGINGYYPAYFRSFDIEQVLKYAPRLAWDEKELLFKATISKRSNNFLWDQIRRIEFQPYRLVICTDGSDHNLEYSTDASTSKKVKSAIREIAESKHIEVIGG